MFDKKYGIFLSGLVFAGMLVSGVFLWNAANQVFAAANGISSVKVFVQKESAMEGAVNGWLGSQENIVVDQITADTYGDGYIVLIGYKAGSTGATATRLKIFDGSIVGVDGLESRVQDFLSSLTPVRAVRSVAAVTGGHGSPVIFVIYD